MFNLFRKKATNSEPHPLKVHFAKTYLPITLKAMRSGFVNAMASDEAVSVLSRSWTKFGLSNHKKRQMIEPVGMDVNVFREGEQYEV